MAKRAIFISLLATLFLASCTFNPASRLKDNRMPNDYLYSDKTFIAMQYYMGILNRTVQVYVLDDMLSVAVVGGVIASPPSTGNEWYNPRAYIDPLYIEKYRNIDPASNLFLSLDSSNYQIKRTSIKKVEFDPSNKWGMGNVPHTGKILVYTTDDKEKEFILLGSQDGDYVKNMIEQIMRLKTKEDREQ
ncbi:MAG TPA: hypothetical protein VMJ66_15340 [Geobacteraceae bacterium]|nr:hypothetical protein [Geobacteraceae bacterium]